MKFRKFLAMLMAVVMVLSLMPTFVFAEEAGTEAAAQASNVYEPWGHGYRFVDILSWDPANDPYSDELVAEVPLQERIPTYAPTQANPNLSDDSKLYAISSSNYRATDTSNDPWNAGMAYDDFSHNAFKFWQYTDMTGSGGRPTQNIADGAADKEYGTIAIPQASATNAAHKNGVLSLAEYFTPRTPQYSEEWMQVNEDGSWPYADKLIEICEYYGFDGYFINQEERIPSEYVPVLKDMMAYMLDAGVYIQWYDSLTNSGSISYQNRFNSTNSPFVWNEEDGQVSNSIFLNYWYGSSYLKDSKAHAESLGLDPYETVFMGVEGGQWMYGWDLENSYNGLDENGKPYTSFALWGSDFYREQFDKTDNNRYKMEYQWSNEERERMYFVSPTGYLNEHDGKNPDGTNVDRSDVGVTSLGFDGFAAYVVEKSVIDGTVFATDFNNGHGMQYFINGEVSRDVEWTNDNLQDIVPTWQWWISGDTRTMEMAWDYGPEFTRHQGAFDYTQIGAYNGGSSVAFYGEVNGTQRANLYKTALDVTADTELSLTYYKTEGEGVAENIVVILQKDETTAETLLFPIETTTGGWNTVTVDLGEYAGRVIAAIAFEVTSESAADYQINLGRLEITDGADYTPAAPENVAIDLNIEGTEEIQISWTLADYDEVKNYHVWAVYADGTEKFVGGGYADELYISTLEDRDNVVALEVRAVGVDGSESEGAQIAIDTTPAIYDIKTVSADNKLVVTWTGTADATVELDYWYCDKENPAAVQGSGNTATFDIELQDGAQYVLTLTAGDTVVHYFGDLADTYGHPYEGEPRLQADGRYDLTVPAAVDWYTATVDVDGNVTTYKRFGGSKMQDISVASAGASNIVITMTDMDGNVSSPVTFMFFNGVAADMSAEYGEDMIPDPALREALNELVGPTLQDLIDYEGALDLSDLGIEDLTGLTNLTGLTEVDLSGNAFTELYASMLPVSVKKITLDNCDALVLIDTENRNDLELVLGDLPALTTLRLAGYGDFALDLSGCPELYSLYLTGTKMTELDITANVKLHNFMIDDSQIAALSAAEASAYTDAYYWVWTGAKLDLSDNTEAGVLKNGMADYFATATLEPEIGTEPVAIVLNHQMDFYYPNVNTVIDLGKVWLLSNVDMWTRSPESYGFLGEFIVEISADGAEYTQLAHITDGAPEYSVPVPEGTSARYIKITDPNDTQAWSYWNIYGYDVAPMGFYYANQQPAMVRDELGALTVEDDGETYQLLDLLDAQYASARTVDGGTGAADLANTDWIDQDYLAEQSVAPSGVKVTITDSQGNVYEYPAEGPSLGEIDTENKLATSNYLASGGYSGETIEFAFDGSATTKWCTSGHTGWAAFELAEPKVVGQWFTLHAGNESSDAITRDFRLQVLNPEAMSEEEYLALDASGKSAVARNSDNWKDIDVVTGNTTNELTREIAFDALASAQVYRICVDESQQADFWGWNIRILEIELYAYTGQLGANVNGLLKADEVEEYTVTYSRRGEDIASTTATVTHGEAEGTVVEPTCTEDGSNTYVCPNCGETVVEVLPATGHDYEAVVTAPTCTEQGYTTYTCANCGDSYVDDYVDATGHTEGEEVIENEVAATCTEDGSYDKVVYCATCGSELSRENVTVPATGHTFGEWTVTTAPTCTEKGVETRTCECGETETREIEALGHDYEDGKCNNCGEKDPDYVEPTTSKPAGDNDSSDTADGFSAMWFAVMLFALAGASVLVISRKRFVK